MNINEELSVSCPVPIQDYPNVLLGHGSGGKLTHQLIDKMFRHVFKNNYLEQGHDGARIEWKNPNLVITTDSYVVKPLFFPGGNIGTLAVNGTVNDLAMCGARPQYISLGLILEEGLSMEALWTIVQSIQKTAEFSGVQIVTGDTKVVEKGKADGIYINTTGIGKPLTPIPIAPRQIQPDDAILLFGDIGRHGMAIMAQREGLEFETQIQSDCASLWKPIEALISEEISIHCLRDCTRGGLATSLVELAQTAKLEFQIEEENIPVQEEVRGACEILGLDPLYVANEGCCVLFVPENEAKKACETLAHFTSDSKVSIIGKVTHAASGSVLAKNLIGSSRIIDMLSGEQLPRIC